MESYTTLFVIISAVCTGSSASDSQEAHVPDPIHARQRYPRNRDIPEPGPSPTIHREGGGGEALGSSCTDPPSRGSRKIAVG
jgi:hypothetical protein